MRSVRPARRGPGPANTETGPGSRAAAHIAAWVTATHPGPVAAVTVIVSAAAWAAGRTPAAVALVALAVVTGQASVGWSNDANDADRDRRAGRTEKPTVRGTVAARGLWLGAVSSLSISIVLSYLVAGPVGGTAHVIALASAWSYNLFLKTTVFSAVPYAVSFGLIPAFITYGLSPPMPPAPWLSVTCALMGVGAHLANALPDIDSDRVVRAGGLAAAVGPQTAVAGALLCIVSAVVLLVGHLDLPTAVAVTIILAVIAASVAVAILGQGRTLFRYVMVLAVAAAVLVIGAAASLTQPPDDAPGQEFGAAASPTHPD